MDPVQLKFIFALIAVFCSKSLFLEAKEAKPKESPTDMIQTFLISSVCELVGLLGPPLCKAWYKNDTGIGGQLEHCPPTVTLAAIDPRFFKASLAGLSYFHPGAVDDYRQKYPLPNGAGQQCVYNAVGTLIVGPFNGGSADRYSPTAGTSTAQLNHIIYDILPYCYCCKTNNLALCNKYYEKRPSDSGLQYMPPMK